MATVKGINNTTLDTQNEVLEIGVTSDETSTLAIYGDGDFDSAAVEIGRKNAAGTFIAFTDGSLSSLFDFQVDVGRNMLVYARALGASPDVDIQTTAID